MSHLRKTDFLDIYFQNNTNRNVTEISILSQLKLSSLDYLTLIG